MSTCKTPVIILEEHHEAFLTWHYARREGMIPATGNHLLHVDSHSDMGQPELSQSINDLPDCLKAIENITYQELDIASFIIPALYQQLITRVSWLHPSTKSKPQKARKYVRTHKEEGRVFLTGSDLPPLTHDKLWQDRKCYMYETGNVKEMNFSESPAILDIDLDYFSCGNGNSQNHKLEVSKEEFERYRNDRYHHLRLQGKDYIEEENGRYFLKKWKSSVPEIEFRWKLSEDQIRQRMDTFIHFLSEASVQPGMITICRSKISGFTPEDQVEFIENVLLTRIHELYPLDVLTINSITSRK